jgi:hypothetical protein
MYSITILINLPSQVSTVPPQISTLKNTLKFCANCLLEPSPFRLSSQIYKKAPTNPATPINTLPAPTTKPSAPLFAVLVEEAPVAVPLAPVLLATLTPPVESVVWAPEVPELVAGDGADETVREMAGLVLVQ